MTENELLKSIAAKTKSSSSVHATKQVFYAIIEVMGYLLFLSLLYSAFFIPDYLDIKLDVVEEEFGFYILEEEQRIFWKSILKSFLIFLSLFSLVISFLSRRSRIKSRIIKEVNLIANKNA